MSDQVTVQMDSPTVRVVGPAATTVRVVGPAVAPRIVVQGATDRVVVQTDASEVRVVSPPSQVIRVVGPPASSATAIGGSVPQKADKDLSPLSSSGDESATAITISVTPTGSSPYVGVSVNGVGYSVGDGTKTEYAYFSNDGGTTARLFGAIVSGDELFWNGAVAGFEILNSRDKINLDYDT